MSATRSTLQKQIILDAVAKLDVHASAEQVYEYVTGKYPSISKATVYRNLRQASQNGDLLDIGILDGCTHYDHRTHSHSHFICTQCKRVFDVEDDFSDTLRRAKGTPGISPTSYHLSFSGTCAACESKKLTDREQLRAC